MSPLEDIESDLLEVQMLRHDPLAMITNRLQGLFQPEPIQRTFLTGANPFVLKADRLMAISDLIRKYIPTSESIGCFARLTDVTLKTDEELKALRAAGYDGLTIGIETGDDEALTFMHKGYQAEDIIRQCQRLDEAGISYSFFYLVSISGAGRGEIGAKLTAEVCNQLHPVLIGANMLTIYPESELYQEIQRGAWAEESEIEKYKEIRVLVDSLTIPTIFAAMGASNAYQFYGKLPQDKEKLLTMLDEIIESNREAELRHYRTTLRHL
jgi:radical SAM superfamily enzyme YgiQ (UPF0313 family)